MVDPAITGLRQHAVNSHEIVSSRAIMLLLQRRAWREFVHITLMVAQRSYLFPLRNSMSHMVERVKIAGGRKHKNYIRRISRNVFLHVLRVELEGATIFIKLAD